MARYRIKPEPRNEYDREAWVVKRGQTAVSRHRRPAPAATAAYRAAGPGGEVWLYKQDGSIKFKDTVGDRSSPRGRGRRDPGGMFDTGFLDAATVDPQEAERHGGYHDLEDDL